MNTPKHTPGPWMRGIGNRIASGNHMIAQTSRIYKSHRGPGYPDLLEQEANADLIAAAPELLAVAKELLEAIDKHFGIDPITAPAPGNLRWRVVAAIVKAEGGGA